MESCKHITYECIHGWTAEFDFNCGTRKRNAHKGAGLPLRDRRVGVIECAKVKSCTEGEK